MTEIMNKDSKSLLAKLMASEDLHVEYSSNASTAMFDTENRVLTVPIFKEHMSIDTTDLMLGHEVGHALFTPQGEIVEVLKKGGMYKNFVNIVEDARIEKMIQSKFPGLRPIFKNAYNELMDKNFFGTQGEDINSYNFIDRLNLHFKAGIRAGVEFNDEEMTYVKRMENLRSWDEVISLSDDLYEYCKAKEEDKDESESPSDSNDSNDDTDDSNDGEMNSNAPSDSDDSGMDEENSDKSESPGGAGDYDSDDSDDSEDGKSEPEAGGEEDVDTSTNEGTTGGKVGSAESASGDSEMEVKTQENFDSAIESSVDNISTVVDISIPVNLDLSKIIVKTSEIHEAIDTEIAEDPSSTPMSHWNSEWKKFSLEQKSIVAYMVKEFEMRKSADEHRRTSVADTGMLNPNKLHAYKFSEDIFLKNAVVADGKNHGFLMYIDWSGSMRPQMQKTIEQLQLLAMFCKKANIPFDCFAFSNQWSREVDSTLEYGRNSIMFNKFNLLHLISSKVKMNEFNKSMAYLSYLKAGMDFGSWMERRVSIPDKLSLGGTPLNEAILTATDMVASFKKMHGLQIVNVVFLTDGAGNRVNHYNSPEGERSIPWNDKCFITDPVTKKKFSGGRFDNVTKTFLEILKNRDCRVIGFFITTGAKRGVMSDLAHAGYTNFYYGPNEDDTVSFWKKILETGYGEIEMPGYDKYFVIKEMNTETSDLKITDDMTKAKMKTAFIKHRKTKLNSKKMLSSFCEFVS